MSSLRNQTNNQDASCAGPHQELYIYYLKGRLKQDSTRLPDNCIGNWEEEDDSFLFFSRPAYEQVESLLSRQPQLSYTNRSKAS
jgi:ribosomal protein L11 methyltransferase